MKLIPRTQWGARTPKYRYTGELDTPSTGHWNGPKILVSGQPTWEHSRCASLVRGVQNFHMDAKGWADIAYNFVVCPHGYVFEGRGINVINGANGTNDGNRSSHALMCLAGDGNPFGIDEARAFKEIVWFVSEHTKAPNRAIGHRDHKATACPGDVRYSWIHNGMPLGSTNPPPPPTPPTPPSSTPILKLGSKGEAVRHVQTIIRNHAGGGITVDGFFGPQTEKRVKDVQKLFNLQQDGIVGPNTWGALTFLEKTKPSPFGNWPTLQKPVTKLNNKGDVVKYLQEVIVKKAGGGIVVDGAFGPQTEKKVKDIQRLFKLTVDGIVGPSTWKVIDFLAIK